MTRRSSLRAQAREIYRDLAAKKVAETTSNPPSPQGFGGVKRRRGLRAKDGFAPVKGARFIRRVDKDKPFATGLKVTDPEGAARAASACGEAASMSRQAQREAQNQAEAERRTERLIRAIEWSSATLGNLRELYERRKERQPGPFDGRYADILFRIAEMALARWQKLLAEEAAAQAD